LALAGRVTVLVLNVGSSSVKYSVWNDEQQEAAGSVDRVASVPEALEHVLAALQTEVPDFGAIHAVGHRVVHGGSRFSGPVLVDEAVERAIDELASIAPLHNPHNLEGIRAARSRFPGAAQVAVFDTAFHQTLPPCAYTYAVPERLGIRRFGFHGISHQYVSARFAQVTGRDPASLRLITCHLGNGCSVCAVRGGRSIDTSMGFTPMEGLVMGTRSGDVDPGALLHVLETTGMTAAELARVLNAESGLAALSGTSGDMRDIERAAGLGDARALLAIEVFCYRVRKYIGAYFAALNGADAVVFTAGVGENSPAIRARICADLDNLGISVDPVANGDTEHPERQIGFDRTAVWVVPTREDLMIARATRQLAAGS
jgi:acetate kinase